ncbi:hypothetical protein ACLB2K_059940 [Fragaria x ananassa]
MPIAFPRITLQHYNALCITAILVLSAKDPIKDYWKRKFGAGSSSHANAIGTAAVVSNTGAAASSTGTS